MVKYEENRRVVARTITFIDNKILLIERHKLVNNEILHYYTIPGGGVEEEEYSQAAIREMKEETCCDIEIVSFLETEDYPNGRCYWFYGRYLKGIPTLGGEEKEINNPDNSYKVVLIDMNKLSSINIFGKGKELIQKCYQEYLKNV